MFGVVPEGKFGTVWLLGTDEIFTHASRDFLRLSKEWLSEVSAPFESVGNLVDARNTVHIRWLEWLGFEFIGVQSEFGVEKRPFLEFIQNV